MLSLEDEDWGPDLLVKTCRDWDRVFFAGKMKGHVSVQWLDAARMPRDFSNPESEGALGISYGYEYSSRWGRAYIYLNADRLLLDRDEDRTVLAGEPPVSGVRFIWAILLYELCHAYLTILTGHKEYDIDDVRDGYDEFHGKYFQRCIHAVDRSARQLLGLGAYRSYSSQYRQPIRIYDVENHIVEPSLVQKCRDGVRSIVRRDKGMSNLLISHSYILIYVLYRPPANVYYELRILRFDVQDSCCE